MDEEIEDLVGEVKYTESQKSVATSNVYSMDFTDSSSDKNNSSGKDTYVIEWDDSSSDYDKAFELHENRSIINLNDKSLTPIIVTHNVDNTINKISKSTPASTHQCSIAQEIFTQTSKTIIELAESERSQMTSIENKTLETQTSFISITENKTFEYRIQVSGDNNSVNVQHTDSDLYKESNHYQNITCNQLLYTKLEDHSSRSPLSETDTEKIGESETDSFNELVHIVSEEESKEENDNEVNDDNNIIFDKSDTEDDDMDDDSLICNEYHENKAYTADNASDTSDVPKSVDSDVEDLYKKLSEKIHVNLEKFSEQDTLRFSTLTPLTEESTMKKESIMDITPHYDNIIENDDEDKYVVFVNNSGVKIKALPDSKDENEKEYFKLPPITNIFSYPSSPHSNHLFGATPRSVKNLLVEEDKREWPIGDRWEIGTKDLASGESPRIKCRTDPLKKINELFQLPPIHATHADGNIRFSTNIKMPQEVKHNNPKSDNNANKSPASINIKDKISELKMSNSVKYWTDPKYKMSSTESKTSRSVSPESKSPEESRIEDMSERGCEALCVELLRRLRSTSWLEVLDTLEELPKVMEKFWGTVSENRIADLIRLVSSHVESPRTQVIKLACSTLAAILKNTGYTKKPDFYEAVMLLLVKTGSYSRPVRRSANMALDAVVCGVELAHAVTALCVHGAGHKSPLVRCAAARLLVVCCALGGGGRELLRTRPPSAACARRHGLRALAALLEDKNTDTRKYAERLYSMLRPLSNFEAFYLTDVDVEVACRQMKKFDQLLLCGPSGETR